MPSSQHTDREVIDSVIMDIYEHYHDLNDGGGIWNGFSEVKPLTSISEDVYQQVKVTNEAKTAAVVITVAVAQP